MLKLVISDNEGTTTVVPLVRDEISIGRQDGNTIRLTERNISRRHAKLVKHNGHYEITDLGSYNGLVLNGARVERQTSISPGDEVQIGDYTITVESETVAVAGEDEATRVVAAPQAPARVVMLGDPTPGAEFSLPAAGVAKLGRSEELSIPINHRSVSREHAEISREGEDYILMDLASANGVCVNGERVDEHILEAGDVIELGQVMFRFVDAGEQYVFDPDEAALHARAYGARANARVKIAAGVVALIAAITIGVVSGGSDSEEVTTAAPEQPAAEEVAADGADAYAGAVAACKEALSAGRFAEAVAHSGIALRARPGDQTATDCQAQARGGHEDEQAFVRGEAALGAGDPEAAHREFQRLTPDSTFRRRPEVAEALEQLSSTRLSRARSLLSSNPEEAARLARRVLALEGLPDAQSRAAHAVVAEASVLQEEQLAAVDSGPTPTARPTARKPRATARRPSPSPRPASRPAQPKGPSLMDQAKQCMSRGDNQCVISALAGKARTAQEIGLLIETYRAMGNTQAARKYMTIYVKRFPSAQKARSYRRVLEQ